MNNNYINQAKIELSKKIKEKENYRVNYRKYELNIGRVPLQVLTQKPNCSCKPLKLSNHENLPKFYSLYEGKSDEQTLSHLENVPQLPVKTGLVRKLSGSAARIAQEYEALKHNLYDEYLWDNFSYMQQIEKRLTLPREYVINHIKEDARALALNRMISLQTEFCISQTSLHSAVRLFDYICVTTGLDANQYNLLAIATLWVSHKYHDKVPSVKLSHLVSSSSNMFLSHEIIQMEMTVLKKIHFHIPGFDIYAFTYILLQMEGLHTMKLCMDMVSFLLECYMLTISFPYMLSSVLSSAAIYLTMENLKIKRQHFLQFVEKYIFDRESFNFVCKKMKEVVDLIINSHSPNQIIITKYMKQEYSMAARRFLSTTNQQN